MASVRLSCFSSIERPCTLLAPGNMPRIFSSGPIFRIILNWARKSLKSNDAVRILRSRRAASSSSTASAAFSTKPTTSPIPRMRTTSRVEDVDVSCLSILPFECRRRRTLNVLLLWIWNKRRNVNLLSQRGELLNRRRPLQIAGNECGRATLFFQQARQLRCRSGFARTIQPDNQDSSGLTEIKRHAVAAEERSQLIVENLNDLLTRGDAAQNVFAERFCLDTRDEIFRDLKIDVGLEQSEPDLAQRAVDVGFADLPMAAQVLENIL